MYDFNTLKMSDIVQIGVETRSLGANAKSMEEAATEFTTWFFNHFADQQTGKESCALIRFFKTHDIDKLPQSLQDFADKLLQEKPETKSFKCLTLLGTAGIEEKWMDRRKSAGHQAIPLPSKEVVNRIPMLMNLIKQMGLDVETVINPDPDLLADLSKKTFNIFYVPEADGSPYIPAQDDFIKRYGVKSVLGFGGILPSGNVFAIILFSRTPIRQETADLFNTLALNLKMLILPFEDRVFSN